MAELPKPVRAYIGLWARAVTEARDLPRRVAELPVLAASSTAKATLRFGQQYADLVNLGDDVLSKMRGTSEEAPSWATFDDDDDDDAPPVEEDAALVEEPPPATPLPAAPATAPATAPRGTRRRAGADSSRKLSAFDRVVEDDADLDPR